MYWFLNIDLYPFISIFFSRHSAFDEDDLIARKNQTNAKKNAAKSAQGTFTLRRVYVVHIFYRVRTNDDNFEMKLSTKIPLQRQQQKRDQISQNVRYLILTTLFSRFTRTQLACR